jgi:hypothetical protein
MVQKIKDEVRGVKGLDVKVLFGITEYVPEDRTEETEFLSFVKKAHIALEKTRTAEEE